MADNLGSKYRLYCLDGGGHISLAEWLDAENDQDAIRQVQFLKRDARKFEVWMGSRLVAQLVDGHVCFIERQDSAADPAALMR
jgi:hypothetical protein